LERHFQAGIVIVTRNREEDLRHTLEKLAAQPGWNQLPILIFDDASDSAGPGYFSMLHKHGQQVLREPARLGYILCRNRANFEAPFEFIFSLDDDSCFIDPEGPARALAYMEANPKVAALSFPQAKEGSDPPKSTEPFPCASFIGCAHLVRKNVFLALGGYRADFVHLGEEVEYSRRLWSAGYEVHAFPGCRVQHDSTAVARDLRRMGYYGPRNRMFTHFLSTPALYLPAQVVLIIGSYLKLSLRTRVAPIHLSGLAAGFWRGLQHLDERWPMSRKLYDKLIRLPRNADET
jgi:GT2 family glycosyltransferase